MLSPFIKQSFRQIASKKLTSAIQIVGLGIGLGSAILMLSYIIHEYSFDKYHNNSGNIYRVVYEKDCSTPYIMGETLKSEIPEITSKFSIYGLWNVQIKKNEEYIKDDNFILADSSIFTVLDIPIEMGNRKFLHQNSNDIVISDKAARKYFGDKNPLGQPLDIIVSGNKITCNITGVYKKFPSNSSIQAEFIGNIKLTDLVLASQTLNFSSGTQEPKVPNNWEKYGFQTFLLISNSKQVNTIENKATMICLKANPKYDRNSKIHLQPFTSMYLGSQELSNTNPLIDSNLQSIKIFEWIGLLILIIAWFNYILLSTAETKSQLKEIACHKVNGASPGQMAQKAFTHSIIISGISLFPALIFVNLTIPLFNLLFEKNIDSTLLFSPFYFTLIIGLTLLTGIAGGSFISFYTARLKPANLFKPLANLNSTKGVIPSNMLIIFQFLAFILLFSVAIVIEKQVKYSENKGQGFNSSNVLLLKLNDTELRSKLSVIKSRLESNPHVTKVAISSFTPPSDGFINLELQERSTGKAIKEEGLFVGADLIELLQIPMLEGSSFKNITTQQNELIINETAAKKYKVKTGDKLGPVQIKGIVKDFHVHSLHTPIKPVLIFKMNDDGCYELVVRTDGHNNDIIKEVKKTWTEVAPTSFLEYELLTDRIASFYTKERNQVKSITFFTSLAIFLAIIGLLGYVSLTTAKRTKEIGIRKVNGAHITEILIMLNRGFIKWVIISFIIACPIAYYAMRQWLQNFAYKTELSWWVFALAGIVAVAVAVLTVSWQSWRAATRNPVESLRYE